MAKKKFTKSGLSKAVAGTTCVEEVFEALDIRDTEGSRGAFDSAVLLWGIDLRHWKGHDDAPVRDGEVSKTRQFFKM